MVEEPATNHGAARDLYSALARTDGDFDAARVALGDDHDTEGALASLLDLRLLRPSADPRRYVVVSPAEAAQESIGAQEASALAILSDAAEVRRAVQDIAVDHWRAVRRSQTTEVLRRGAEISGRIDQLLREARRSVLTAHPTMAPAEVLGGALELERAMLGRGVEMRDLYPHSALRHPPSLTYMRSLLDAGGQVRTAALIPNRMIIVDDHTAVVPVDDTEGAAAAVVHDPAILVFLRAIHEFLWDRGHPLQAVDNHSVSTETEAAILQELAAGRTDEAIARRLGMSTRSLRRQLTAIYAARGVTSRFQLGLVAARDGLVSGDGGD